MTSITVGLVQQTCSEEKDANLTASAVGIREAAAQGANCILLQELHATRYFCQTENTDYFDMAESIPGPTTNQLAALAQELSVVIVSSIFERRAPGIYHNTAVVIEKTGEIAGIYRKMHIPDDPGYYEKFYFTPGDLGFKPIKTSVGKLGVLVCWDQWYPEAARLMALAGADILFYPTAIGWDPKDTKKEKLRQKEAWITIQRAHAIANGVPVVVCNRSGFEPDPSGVTEGSEFWGHSFIAGPQGEILASSRTEEVSILTAEIDYGHSEKVRRMWPFFRDRRIDAFDDLTRRFID